MAAPNADPVRGQSARADACRNRPEPSPAADCPLTRAAAFVPREMRRSSRIRSHATLNFRSGADLILTDGFPAARCGIHWCSYFLHHLNVMAHLVAQKISRAIDARLHSSFAGRQNLSDLVIALAFN